jgi:hypothetical protein
VALDFLAEQWARTPPAAQAGEHADKSVPVTKFACDEP